MIPEPQNTIYERHSAFYQLFRKAMVGEDTTGRETAFLQQVFSLTHPNIQSVIDLGGGIGAHATPLSSSGYDVTVYDQSAEALETVRQHNSNISTLQGTFETIDIPDTFDTAISMWTTFPFIIDPQGREQFFKWMATHARTLIILDQSNFYQYPETFEHSYIAEDDLHEYTLHRSWKMNKNNVRTTLYTHEITEKRTDDCTRFEESEVVQFLSIDQIQQLLGDSWKKAHLLGDYSLDSPYERDRSERLIGVWKKT